MKDTQLPLNYSPKFPAFSSMLNSVFKKSLSLSTAEQKIIEEKSKVSKEIDSIIETNNSTLFEILMKNKVELKFNQVLTIITKRPSLGTVYFLQNIKNHGVDTEIKDYVLDQSKKIIKAYTKKIKWSYDDAKAIAEKLTSMNIFLITYAGNLYRNDSKSVNELYPLLVEISKCASDLSPRFDYFREQIKGFYNDFNKERIVDLSKVANILSTKNIQENMKLNAINEVKEFSCSEMPKSSQKLLSKINILFLELQSNNLEKIQELEVENLYVKKLPKVLSQYAVIGANYREKLKDLPDSPDNLLSDSLGEIKNKLSTIMDSVQEENHRALKITNRYIKII